MIAEKSRAEYFRKRRETLKQFTVSLKKEKIEALECKLAEQNKTKTAWLEEKIDEEITSK